MSSTSNSQNLLVNVFRPAFVYSAGSGFTPKLVLSNVDIVKADEIQTGKFSIGDSAGNVFVGSNVGQGAIVSNASNVGIGVGAMGAASNTKTSVAIGYNALSNANSVSNAIAIGANTTLVGTNSIVVGYNSSTLGSNMILLGPNLTTTGDVSGKLFIGQNSISNATITGNLNTRQVGIATTDPSHTLDVSGDVYVGGWLAVGLQTPMAAIHANGYVYATSGFAAQGGSASAPAFTFLDDSGTGFYQRDNGFAITTKGVERVFVSDASFGIDGDLWVTGTVNISGVATNNLAIPGYIRIPSTTAPEMDLSGGYGAFTGTVRADSGLLTGSSGYIRVGTGSIDMSGGNVRSANVFATGYVQTPFVHDAGGTYDMSGGNLRVNSNITFGNVLRSTAGTIRIGNIAASTIEMSGSEIRADGNIRGGTLTSGAGSAAAPSHRFSNDTTTGLFSAGTNQLGFSTAGTQRMVISNGNVAIGKSIPSVALEVVGDISATTYNGPGGSASAPHYTSSDDRTTGVFFPGSNIIGFTAGNTERVRISNGNVGIGTVAPATALEISGGALRITSSTGGPIVLSNGTINISGTTVVSATGVLSNATTTSNSIGGVTLSNTTLAATTIRNALSSWTIDISGGNISNSATNTSSNFIGTSTASNQIGGVTLSNTTLAATTIRNALSSWTIDISGGNISNSATNTSSNFVTPTASSNNIGGVVLNNNQISNSSTTTSSNFATPTASSNSIGGIVLSNTRIGVGTTAPNAPIEVRTDAGDTSMRLYSSAASAIANVLALQFVRTNTTYGASSNTSWGVSSYNNSLYFTNQTNGAASTDLFLMSSGTSGQLLGGVNGTLANPLYSFNASSNTGMYLPGTGQLGFTTGGTQRMVISNANVGIGTPNPAYSLEVSGTTVIRGGVSLGGPLTAGSYLSFDSNVLYNQTSTGGLFIGAGGSPGSTISNRAGTIFVNADGSRVGIGKTNPAYRLDVCDGQVRAGELIVGSNQVGYGAIKVLGGSGNNTMMFYDSCGSTLASPALTGWILGTNNAAYGNNTSNFYMYRVTAGSAATTPTVTVTPGGNVGIGTTAPIAALDVGTTTGISGEIVSVIARSAQDSNFRLVGARGDLNNLSGGLAVKFGLLHRSDVGAVASNALIRFYRGGDVTGGFMAFSTSNDTERMRIDSAGNVGIGTSSPTQVLDVCGSFIQMRNVAGQNTTVRLAPNGITDGSGIQLSHNTLNQFGLFCAFSNGTMVFSNNSSPFVFSNAGAEHARLTAAGRLGIGTPGPAHALDVNGTIRGSSNIVSTATATYNMSVTFNSISASTETDLFSLAFTPKQSGSVNLLITLRYEAQMSSSGGDDYLRFSLTDGTNAEIAFNNLDVYVGSGDLGRTSIIHPLIYYGSYSGAQTFKMRYRCDAGATANIRRGVMTVYEMSQT